MIPSPSLVTAPSLSRRRRRLPCTPHDGTLSLTCIVYADQQICCVVCTWRLRSKMGSFPPPAARSVVSGLDLSGTNSNHGCGRRGLPRRLPAGRALLRHADRHYRGIRQDAGGGGQGQVRQGHLHGGRSGRLWRRGRGSRSTRKSSRRRTSRCSSWQSSNGEAIESNGRQVLEQLLQAMLPQFLKQDSILLEGEGWMREFDLRCRGRPDPSCGGGGDHPGRAGRRGQSSTARRVLYRPGSAGFTSPHDGVRSLLPLASWVLHLNR